MRRQAAIRQLAILLAICVPLALLASLWGASFFDSYQGEVVAWRPLQAADGKDDRVKRFLLVRPGGQYQDVELPSVAFSGHDLPVSISGVPPLEVLEAPPQVKKDPFGFTVTVDGTAWSTLSPQAVVLPLLFLVVVVLGRNLVVTGSAFELVAPERGTALPGLHRPREGSPEPVKSVSRGHKGPPPQGNKGKSKGARANRRKK